MPIKLRLGGFIVNWRGEEFSPADVETLTSRKRAEAIMFCPALRSLSCSRFDIECSILDGAITLVYYLIAAEVVIEHGLFLDYAGRPTTVERVFEDEAYRVFEELKMVRISLSIAMSPTISRADLLRDEPSASERRQLRLAAKHFSGSLLELPGVDRSTEFVVDIVPLYLPTGAKARISARVKSMTRAEAFLTRIELHEYPPALGPGFSLPEKMKLRRKHLVDFAVFGPLLLHAQDNRLRITLDVVVLFAWTDASELILDLVTVVHEPDAPA